MEMQSLETFFTAQHSAATSRFHRALNLKKTPGLKSFVRQTERCVEAGRQKGYLESASAYALFNLVTTEQKCHSTVVCFWFFSLDSRRERLTRNTKTILVFLQDTAVCMFPVLGEPKGISAIRQDRCLIQLSHCRFINDFCIPDQYLDHFNISFYDVSDNHCSFFIHPATHLTDV